MIFHAQRIYCIDIENWWIQSGLILLCLESMQIKGDIMFSDRVLIIQFLSLTKDYQYTIHVIKPWQTNTLHFMSTNDNFVKKNCL